MTRTIESFVACFPYTAVAAMLPGEAVVFQESAESPVWRIEKANSGHGYIYAAFESLASQESGPVAYAATAREVREAIIGTPFESPLVTLA